MKMQMTPCSCCVLFLALMSGSQAAEVTPVQKVVKLMEGMLKKGDDEMVAEQKTFANYKLFCETTHKAKAKAIADGEDAIEAAQATIQKTKAFAKKLTREIAAHDADISTWSGDEVAARKVREIDNTEYKKLHEDYSESVDALGRAIEVLQKQKASSFIQMVDMKSLNLPKKAQNAIDAFLSVGANRSTGPSPKAYEFQSQGIIDFLGKLLDKFIAERTSAEKAEMKSKNAFDILMAELKTELAYANKVRGDKAKLKASTLQQKADAEGDLADLTKTLEDDKKYDSDLVATCSVKAGEFDTRQQLRMEELEAIKKAIEVIESPAVSGSAEKHLPTLLQTKKSALAALRSGNVKNDFQERAAAFLLQRSHQLNSKTLSMLAARMAADPFTKVKKMIKDLILKLMEEATAEVEHKGWCDTEMTTNKQTREETTEAVETLTAEVDELEASLAKLAEEISTLTAEVAGLDKAMAEATQLRAAEKAKNAETISDAKEAQVAVAQAMTVLNEFYAKAAEATALLQGRSHARSHQEPPPIFDSPYKGMSGENGGVISMLEVINSDFARLQADTEGAEVAAVKEYDQFTSDSKIDKSAKAASLENMENKKYDMETKLRTTKADLEGTQKELTAALAYYDKLKPSCVDAGVEFSDRTARRREEIESLQEALHILIPGELGV